MQLSRSELLERFKLSETTLVQLEALPDSPLMDGAAQQVVRGRIMYEVDENLDAFLRAGVCHYLNTGGAPFPSWRAILALMISEIDSRGRIYSAVRTARGRGVLLADVAMQAMQCLWTSFMQRAPAESVPYLSGRSNDASAPATKHLLNILGVADLLDDPERAVSKIEWLLSPELRVLTDGLFAAGAEIALVKQYLSKAYRFDVTDDSLREYRRYFFDTTICAPGAITRYLKDIDIPLYQRCVSNALHGGVGSVLSDLQLNPLIDMRTAITQTLRKKQVLLTAAPSRITGLRQQTEAVRDVTDIYAKFEAIDRANIAQQSEMSDDDAMLEVLKLQHNQQTNEQQLSITDLPKDVRDGFVTGPLKAKS